MRGKDTAGKVEILAPGITPAYAGKSRPRINFPVTVEDHPRLCGEKPAMHRFTAMHGGSPPPMRGKDVITKDGSTYARITPAYAGKSFRYERSLGMVQDHPRLCGEKFQI